MHKSLLHVLLAIQLLPPTVADAEKAEILDLKVNGPRSDTDDRIGSLLRRAYVAHAEQIRQRLGVSLVIDRPFVCRVFKDPNHYPVPGLPGGTIDGYTMPGSGIMCALIPPWTDVQSARLGSLPIREAWMAAHESVHQVCVRAGLRLLPPWYAEGLAECLSDEFLQKEGMPSVVKLQYMPPLYDAIQRGTLPSVAEILAGDPVSWKGDIEYYAAAWALVAMARDRRGAEFSRFEEEVGKAFREGQAADAAAVSERFLEICGPPAALDEALRVFVQPQKLGWSGGDLSVSGSRWTLAATTEGGAWLFQDNNPLLTTLPATITVSIEIPDVVGKEARIELWDRRGVVSVCLSASANTITISTPDRALAERNLAVGALSKAVQVRVGVEPSRVAVFFGPDTDLETRLPRELDPPLRLWLGQREGITTYELPPKVEKPESDPKGG
jgi:hypothetical protein